MNKDEQKVFYKNLGAQIKAARNKLGLKQELFANLISLSRASVVNIEKGRQRPQLHILHKIASALEVNLNDLFPAKAKNEVPPEWKEQVKKQAKNKNSGSKVMNFLNQTKENHDLKKN